MRRQKFSKKQYITELNRCIGDQTSRVIGRLERLGYQVDRLPHLTTLRIRRPLGKTFLEFKSDLRRCVQSRRGSILLASSTGRSWICNMRGNRPGTFVRVM